MPFLLFWTRINLQQTRCASCLVKLRTHFQQTNTTKLARRVKVGTFQVHTKISKTSWNTEILQSLEIKHVWKNTHEILHMYRSSQNTPKSGDQRCVKELMIKRQSSKGSIVLHLYVNEQTKYWCNFERCKSPLIPSHNRNQSSWLNSTRGEDQQAKEKPADNN